MVGTINIPRDSNSAVKNDSNTLALAGIFEEFVKQGGETLKMLIQIGMTNGLVGALVLLAFFDYMHQKKVMTDFTFNLSVTLITASIGVDLTGSLIADIESGIPFATPPKSNVAIPSVTTLVTGGDTSVGQLSAILGKLKG